MPLPRSVYTCARVFSAGGFGTIQILEDAIARGSAIVVEYGPCEDGLAPMATPAPTPKPAATPRPTPTPMAMHSWSGDPSLTWRWLDNNELTCTYSEGSCWGILVQTAAGCSTSLYAEITIMDASGVAIDYANDVSGALAAGQAARLIFDTFNASARTATLGKLDCY